MGPVEDKTKEIRLSRRLSYIVLCAGLVLVTVVFGVRATYIPAVYFSLALAQLTVICVAAWKLGARAIRGEAKERRSPAVAGALLIMPWALFSFLAGIATPQQATAQENQLRYLVLLINTIAVAGGLVVLREALSEAGERFYSTLGFAAIMLASPLYAIFTVTQLGEYRAMERGASALNVSGFTSLDELSLILLFFGVVLTYLATTAFAAALGQVGWLGRTASRAFIGTSLFAALCVGIKMAEVFASPQNPMWSFETWYTIPGQVFSIPAMPWIMLCVFGVVFLRRAGEE